MKTEKTKKSWGGQGNGRGGYYPKKEAKQNLPWRQQNRVFPYPYNLEDMLEDPTYIADRNQLFRDNGNGWWARVFIAAYPTRLKRKGYG
jgi:hypothetical protein